MKHRGDWPENDNYKRQLHRTPSGQSSWRKAARIIVVDHRQMKENLAQRNFGMSLAEFTDAWLAGEFDGNRELHGRVIGLAMMLPEYWNDSN